MSSREQDRGVIAAALSEARRQRSAGKLKAAIEALDRAVPLCPPEDPNAARAVSEEGAKLALALGEKGSILAALSEVARALGLNPENQLARDTLDKCVIAYDRWAPPMGAVAPGDQLVVGATGAFWVNRNQRGRVVVLQGGINGETVPAARKALEVAAQGSSWMLLNMKKLVYVGSTGLAATVKVAESLEKGGGGLVLYQVASNLAIVINTLGLGRYLRVVPDLQTALAITRGSKVPAETEE